MRFGHPAAILLTAACASVSCARCGEREPPKDAAVVDVAAAPSASPPAPDAAPRENARDAATAAFDASATDAGPSACRLAYGPAEQSFRGPAALVITPTELRVIANDMGKPRVYPVPLAAPPPASAPPVMPPAPNTFTSMRWPPCEIAGRWAYCQAQGGLVYRTTLGAADTKQIAKSRASTRIAAAPIGEGHAVVATLDVRHTTEGDMVQAFVTLDEGETTRLSEEGAGATVVRLVARGERVVALYLDARTAMVPVHARPLSLRKGGALEVEDDAVVFVGGPPERGIELAVAGVGSSLYALVPLAHETSDFGMAAIPIDEHPKDDVKPVWSMYPNGLDPAPLAGTAQLEDPKASAAWVARVRPSERMVGAPRVLELGHLDRTGSFESLGVIATGKRITDLAVAADAFGSVWVLYGDTSSTWLERRVCPASPR